MCLVTVAFRASSRYPLVIAANRDERHDRASAAAGWWSDAPNVIGGRDLVAGGSWLAIDTNGRLAAVTNRPPHSAARAPESRGRLVADFVVRAAARDAFANDARANGERFGPFNLILVDDSGVSVVSNCGDGRELEAGIVSLASTGLDADWPKLSEANRGIEAALATDDPVIAALELLAPRRRHAAEPLVDSSDSTSDLFIVGDEFGTRCSTVIGRDADDNVTFVERRFDRAARMIWETRIGFVAGAGSGRTVAR